ncbi:hypothetical protein Daus18300_002946 [Diaporthe australafricana]|uniref:SET domain-containing protein n=1 Tax=Diaporthe australafricana TaxID=127596 RepID=A0ABR3XK11_9PEZI
MTNSGKIAEVRPTGDGMGIGLFATMDIPMGTRILAESPLIFLPRSETPFLKLCDAVSLIDPKMTGFADLHCNTRLLNENLPGNIITQIRSENPQSTVDVQNKAFRSLLELYAIYHTNAVIITKDNKDTGSGVFLTYSRINHSCIPNAYHMWNASINRQIVHAGRDISAGQQIFVSYLGDSGDIMTREQRLKETQLYWGFVCSCKACTQSETTDVARKKMRDLRKALDQSYQLWPPADSKAGKIIALNALHNAQKLLHLMEEADLRGWRLCQA